MFKQPMTFLLPEEPITNMRLWRRLVLRTCAETGIKHIVLREEMLSRFLSEREDISDVLEDIKEFGLDFVDAHATFGLRLDLNCPYPEFRARAIAIHKAELVLCNQLNVDTITIHVGNNGFMPPEQEPPLEQHLRWISESLEQLLPDAERLGVTICIENIWWPTSTPERLLEFKRQFPTDYLGFCYDSGHANVMRDLGYKECNADVWLKLGYDKPEWDTQILEKMLPYVVNCHLHDNHGQFDEHLRPGAGNIDWPHIVGLLKKAPKLRCIQCETTCLRSGSTQKQLADAMNRLSDM